MTMELSIVMPSLNEAETIAVCIRKAQSYIEQSGMGAEIIVSNSGLTDGSPKIAAGLGARSFLFRCVDMARQSAAQWTPPMADLAS